MSRNEKELKKELRKQLMIYSPNKVRMRLDDYEERIAEHPDDACMSTSDLAKLMKEIIRLRCSDLRNLSTQRNSLMSCLATIIMSFHRDIMNFQTDAVVDDYLDDFFTVRSELISVLDSYIEKQD